MALKFFQQCLRDNGSNRSVLDRVEDLDVCKTDLGSSCWARVAGICFLNSYIGDAGNTSLVDAGTPLARPRSLHQGVLVIYFGSAATWRPCNVVRPHQGPVSHS